MCVWGVGGGGGGGGGGGRYLDMEVSTLFLYLQYLASVAGYHAK